MEKRNCGHGSPEVSSQETQSWSVAGAEGAWPLTHPGDNRPLSVYIVWLGGGHVVCAVRCDEG